jgi:hypothetical protein
MPLEAGGVELDRLALEQALAALAAFRGDRRALARDAVDGSAGRADDVQARGHGPHPKSSIAPHVSIG